MKFKVGQKVRMVIDCGDARRGAIGIIQALPCSSSPTYDSYAIEFPCFAGTELGHSCSGLVPSNNGHWISENKMEPLTSFQDKLDRLLKEHVGSLVKSKEIADELVKVFERSGMKSRSGYATVAESMGKMWERYRVNTYVTYNYYKGEHKLSCGHSDDSGETLDELLDVTLDEIKEYLESSSQNQSEITQVTIIGEPKNPCVIKMRAKVTKNENGYTIEKLAEPKFAVGEQFATASGKLGKVTKVNPEGHYCVQWFTGKSCSAQPEDTMHKIVWGN